MMLFSQRFVGKFATFITLASLGGCGGNVRPGDGGVTPPTTDASPDTALPPTSPDGGPGLDAGPPPMPDGIRFVAIGDTGEGNEAQFAVGRAINTYCAANGCDFVVMLGDNFYDSGVVSVDDPQWQTKFEEPYADIELPFYVVLGNHDYGGYLGIEPVGTELGGLGNEFDKGPIEVAYTERSSKWTMPATFYTFQVGPVGFIMLDTNSLMWGDTENGDQRAWYPDALRELEGAEWIISAGHHPVRSNGRHGNAGNYESIEVAGVPVPNPIPLLNGSALNEFFDDVVCGTVDLYLAGHDHNRQWINEPTALCGAELIVSGAGAKTTDLVGQGNTTHFEDDSTEGFVWFEIRGLTMEARFIDREGRVEFEQIVERRPRP